MRFIKRAILLAALCIAPPAFAGDYGFEQPFLNITGPNTLTGTTLSGPVITTPTLTVLTSGFTIEDPTDTTKTIVFSASGETTGKTATIAAANSNNATFTLPAATGTLAALNAAQTWTAAQTFTNSDILLLGSSTGATTLTSANAGASNFTATLPGATDTIAELTQAQTFTNKTLTSPVITGPVPVACGATCTLGTANIRATTLLNQAAGSTVTLPGATGTGNVYPMLVTVATTSATEKILTNPTTDTIIGTAIGENGGTAKIFVGNASTYHSVQMPFTGSQPSGGFIGDAIVCTDVATATWQCQIIYQAGTTPTTPYSASTS